jgi:putative DNA primase/helicase
MSILPPAPEGEWDALSRLDQTTYLARELKWKIIPLHGVIGGKCTCGSDHLRDPHSIGKHPTIGDWMNQCSDDPSQLTTWFEGHDELNYGVVAERSGLLVLDFDVRAGGLEEYWAMYSLYIDQIGVTVAVETGTDAFAGKRDRGIHEYYYLPEGQYKFRKNLEKLGRTGVDVKVNGYLVGPGSIHRSGVRYSWANDKAPWQVPISTLSNQLLVDLTHSSRSHGSTLQAGSDSLVVSDLEWSATWKSIKTREVETTPYAEKALNSICKEIEQKRKVGSRRNDALNAAAFSLGKLIGGGQISLPLCISRLRASAQRAYGDLWTIKEAAVDNTLREDGGGFEAGAREPKYPNDLSPELLERLIQGLTQNNDADLEVVLDDIRSGFFEGKSLKKQTLEKAIQALGPVCSGYGKKLFYYENGVWREDGESEVIRRVDYLLGEDARPIHSQTMIHFLSAQKPKISNLGDPDFLNFRNGMLNIRTLELSPHNPNFYSTVQLSCDWTPDATSPKFDQFLDEMAYEDCVPLLLEMMGQALCPTYGFPVAFFLEGSGRNGKSTLLRALSNLVPDEFSASVTLQALGKDKFAAAQLAGKLVNIVGDLSSRELEDTALFKQLTGQDRVPAEVKYGQPFHLRNCATMIFAVNKMPHAYDLTHGFFSRVLIIPFDKKFLRDQDIDPNLELSLLAEAPGIAVKAVTAYSSALSRKSLSKNRRTQEASARYFGELKSVESFMSLCMTKVGSAVLSNEAAYQAYVDYCRGRGWEPRTRADLLATIRQLWGVEEVRVKNIRSLRGVGLLTS